MHAHCKQKSGISKGLMNIVNTHLRPLLAPPADPSRGLTIFGLLACLCCLPAGPEFSRVTRRKGWGFKIKCVPHTKLPGWSVGKGSRADHPRGLFEIKWADEWRASYIIQLALISGCMENGRLLTVTHEQWPLLSAVP